MSPQQQPKQYTREWAGGVQQRDDAPESKQAHAATHVWAASCHPIDERVLLEFVVVVDVGPKGAGTHPGTRAAQEVRRRIKFFAVCTDQNRPKKLGSLPFPARARSLRTICRGATSRLREILVFRRSQLADADPPPYQS